MRFCTAINCMDGRVQLPVIQFLTRRFGVKYVDSVTRAGPVKLLAEGSEAAQRLVFDRVRVSVQKHKSRAIAVVAHHDCAGNPVDEATQIDQLALAVELVRRHFGECEVIALWVDEQWDVREIPM